MNDWRAPPGKSQFPSPQRKNSRIVGKDRKIHPNIHIESEEIKNHENNHEKDLSKTDISHAEYC